MLLFNIMLHNNDHIQLKYKTGILLINVGTPDYPSVWSVTKYLHQFLSDPKVLDLPYIIRKILLYGIILPFRSFSSAELYKNIWCENGSPLLINTANIANKLNYKLSNIKSPNTEYIVDFAMRYGKPSIQNKINTLEQAGCEELIIIPLYPQYAESSTGTAIQEVLNITKTKKKYNNKIKIINHFYDNKMFINAWVENINKNLINTRKNFDYLIFSYHGLPQKHLAECKNNNKCDFIHKCPQNIINSKLDKCYRAQCYVTSDLIAKGLNLPIDKYQVAFQSRLGRAKWIEPYTDQVLSDLRGKNIKNLAVACPAFVADCLETLEEIGIRLKHDWLRQGGNELYLVPCLNDNNLFIEFLSDIIG